MQNLKVTPKEALEIVDTSLISVDVKNLGACNYATKAALYNVGGIVDGDKDNTSQVNQQMLTDGGIYYFNFCEAKVTPPEGCDDGDYYAYYIP